MKTLELRPFLETPKLILTFIQTTAISLKQRLMKKLKQNAFYHKINILLKQKKTTKKQTNKKKKKNNNNNNNMLCVFKSFQYINH